MRLTSPLHVGRRAMDHWSSAGVQRGFTLVELLVVVVIITILASLLIPAVFFAVNRAKTARVGLELAALSKALERYKLEYGEYPPDFTHDPTVTTPDRINQLAASINQHLARTHRLRVPIGAGAAGQLQGDLPLRMNLQTGQPATGAMTAADLANLDPAEALYFWLKGFSEDPQAPLSGAGSREPLFDFDPLRWTDRDGDGFLEYHPKGDSNKTPYVYYAARNTGSDATAYDLVSAFALWARQSGNFFSYAPLPYRTDRNLGGTYAYAEPQKFQILSAGLDGAYGQGGQVVFGTATLPKEERDNLTSFSGGKVLSDATRD